MRASHGAGGLPARSAECRRAGAFWASLLLGVAPGFLGIARLLVLDGLLTLCVTTSVLCWFEAIRTGTFKPGWWLAAAVCSGLGFLTKGPISEVLLFPPLVAFGWMHRDRGASARIGWKDCLLFAAVVVGVNLPWYVAMGMKQPESYGTSSGNTTSFGS